MITADYARAMARYNRWMNEKLYACAATLSDDERKRDRGAFFKSIHGTFNHLMVGDRLWLDRLLGESQPRYARLDLDLFPDFDALARERAKLDGEIDAYAASLDNAALAQQITYRMLSQPITATQPRWFCLMQFFNHQTHHRGQVTTLLMQAGVDPGVTDLLRLPGVGNNPA